MKTTGTLIPEVRAALRRGDCAGARILIGDAQRGRLSPRQQTTVRRLLQTVARCDVRQGVGRSRKRQLRGQGAYDDPPFASVAEWNEHNRRRARDARALQAKADQADRDGAPGVAERLRERARVLRP